MRALVLAVSLMASTAAKAGPFDSGLPCFPGLGAQLPVGEIAGAVNALGLSDWTSKGDSLQTKLYSELQRISSDKKFKAEAEAKIESSKNQVRISDQKTELVCEARLQQRRNKVISEYKCALSGTLSAGPLAETLFNWLKQKQKPRENGIGDQVVSLQGQGLQLTCSDRNESGKNKEWLRGLKRVQSCSIGPT